QVLAAGGQGAGGRRGDERGELVALGGGGLGVPPVTMTKLLEWISVASALLAVWYSLVGGYVKHPAIENNMNLIIVSPIIFVILFGLYAVTVILYRVFSFNNCEDAAKELQAEILEAKKDLASKGLSW
ncbi:hypothetical protein MSG28_001800, partial [Choristoneura fumiferana]